MRNAFALFLVQIDENTSFIKLLPNSFPSLAQSLYSKLMLLKTADFAKEIERENVMLVEKHLLCAAFICVLLS